MATKKPPKPKEPKINIPDVSGYQTESVDDYDDYYKEKPLGTVNITADSRAGAIQQLENDYSGYLDTRSKLIDDYYATNDTDWGDVLTQALLTIGPMVAGYALDKNQGGVYGSQIGLNAGERYRQEVERENELKRYRAGRQLENVDAQISAADKLRREYLEKDWDLQDQRQLRADDRDFEEQKYQNRRGDRLEDLAAQLQMRSQYAGGGRDAEIIPDFERNALRQNWEATGRKWEVPDEYPIDNHLAKQIRADIDAARLGVGEARRGSQYTGDTTSSLLAPIPGATPSKRNVQIAEQTRNTVDNLNYNLGELAASLADGADFTGPGYAEQRRRISQAIDQLRLMKNQGANFTEMEKMLNVNQLVNLPSEDATAYFIDRARGVNAQKVLGAAMSDFERYAQTIETGNKLYNPNKQYMPGTLDRVVTEPTTPATESSQKYSEQQLRDAGYSDGDIQSLRAKGMVQ